MIAAQPGGVGALPRRASDKLAGFFIGQVMKATKGQADGKAVVAELRAPAG